MKPQRRRRALRFVVTLCLVLALIEGAAIARYVMAEQGSRHEETRAAAARSELKDIATVAETLSTDAGAVQSAPDALLVPPAEKAALTQASVTLSSTLIDAEAALRTPRDGRSTMPWTPWDLFAAASALDVRKEAAEASREQAGHGSHTLDSATHGVKVAAEPLLATAAAAASTLESSHISARNATILSLREHAASLAAHTDFTSEAARNYAALATAANAVAVSAKSTLASKAGPLYENRLAVETFARQLAPQILLDFTWAPLVNGAGDGNSLGGYATWWYDRGGYATIELSDSVAALWPSDRTKALVAHEVGHTVTITCKHLYDTSSQDSLEDWATAWAITRGFSDDANGTSAYGAPSQSMIDAASQCK